jgi:hypothetical protein
MILRIALLLVGLPLLGHGGDSLYHAAGSQSQVSVSCQDYQRSPPRSGWLRVKGCEIDYVRAGYRESRGRVTELFVPIRPLGSSPAQPAALVLSTRDPALLAIVERGLAGPAQKDREAFLVMMLKIVTAMGISSQIDGYTRSPLEMLRTRVGLAAIKAPLEDGFAVLDLGARPRLLFPILEFLGGAVTLLTLLFRSGSRGRRVNEQPFEPTATMPPPEGTAPSPSAVGTQPETRFRRLMLVNLPPQAAPSELEKAPPLGHQAGVRSALTSVLPGITFDAGGVGHFQRPDHSIRLDLGRAPEVWTATLDVTGDAAPAALRRLITQTGWQAYAPLLGRFLTSEDLTKS